MVQYTGNSAHQTNEVIVKSRKLKAKKEKVIMVIHVVRMQLTFTRSNETTSVKHRRHFMVRAGSMRDQRRLGNLNFL